MIAQIKDLVLKAHIGMIRFSERIRGVDFCTRVSNEYLNISTDIGNDYEMSSPRILCEAMRRIQDKGSSGFVDFGCGKGRVLVEATKYWDDHQILGIEINKEIANIAKNNMKVLGHPNIKVINDNAINVKNLSTYSYFYFFNPFPAKVFSHVIENIVESYRKHPRKITLIYHNPVCADSIEKTGIFKKTDEIQMGSRLSGVADNPTYIYSTDFEEL